MWWNCGRGRATGRSKEGQVPDPQVKYKHIRAEGESRGCRREEESGAQEGGSQSWKPGLCGCKKSHLSLCKHTLRHTNTHAHTLRAQFTQIHTHVPRRAQRHIKVYPCNHTHTHTHKYEGTLRHINTRCPHKHTRVPVRSHAPLCSGFLPCIKYRNTASGWIVEAGSVAYHKTGPCLTLLSHQDETPREHCTPWAEGLGFLCEGVGQAPVCLPTSPQDRPLRAGSSGGLRAGGLPPPV